MSRKLFVGGLAWVTTDAGLYDAFSPFGTIVEAKVICDRETGRSRGFGFVTYEREEDALRAESELQGSRLDGRRIRIDASERVNRNSSDRPSGDQSSGDRRRRSRSNSSSGLRRPRAAHAEDENGVHMNGVSDGRKSSSWSGGDKRGYRDMRYDDYVTNDTAKSRRANRKEDRKSERDMREDDKWR